MSKKGKLQSSGFANGSELLMTFIMILVANEPLSWYNLPTIGSKEHFIFT